MKACVIIVVIAVAFTSAAIIKSTKNTQSSGEISPLLKLVVTVDGKSFFVDTSENRTWTAASNYCKGLGMRLASITSAAQWTALTTSNIPEFPKGYYWTAARDSQTIEQFRWDHNNSVLYASFIKFVHVQREYLSCVTLDTVDDLSNPHLRNDVCSHLNYVLCETY